MTTTTTTSTLGQFNSDLMLHIASYLNIQESGRWALCAKRYYYLVHQYRSVVKGPELVMSSSWDAVKERQLAPATVLANAKAQLQSAPNLILVFETGPSALINFMTPTCFPPNSIVLASISSDIQVNHPHSTSSSTTHTADSTRNGNTTTSTSKNNSNINLQTNLVEHKSNASIMCCSFPNATIEPFVIESYLPRALRDEKVNQLQSKLLLMQQQQQQEASGKGSFWKAIIIYVAGDGNRYCESVIQALQHTLPDVAIIGGINDNGYISRSPPPRPPQRTATELSNLSIRDLRTLYAQLDGAADTRSFLEKSDLVSAILQQQQGVRHPPPLFHAEDAVFGVVLGGEVPIRSMVSRGVTSYCHGGGKPQQSSPLVVHSSATMILGGGVQDDGDDNDDEDMNDLTNEGGTTRRLHMIHHIRNVETGHVYSAMDLLGQIRPYHPQFIGIRLPDTDGFELHGIMNPHQTGGHGPPAFVVVDNRRTSVTTTTTTTTTMESDNTNCTNNNDNYSLEGAQVDFFTLTGQACMDDMDRMALKLRQQTQGEQILGAIMFSCAGRGPNPGGLIRERMSDATRFSKLFPDVPCLGFYAGGEIGPLAMAGKENIFQTGQTALQGFTVVFALFIVPILEHRILHHLDDCPDNVTEFVQGRLRPVILLQ
jgi:FIST C domain